MSEKLNIAFAALLVFGLIYAASRIILDIAPSKAPDVRHTGSPWDYVETLNSRLESSNGAPASGKTEYQGGTIINNPAEAGNKAGSYLAEYKSTHHIINYTIGASEEFAPYWENPLCKSYYAVDYQIYYETNTRVLQEDMQANVSVSSIESTMLLCDNGRIVMVTPAGVRN